MGAGGASGCEAIRAPHGRVKQRDVDWRTPALLLTFPAPPKGTCRAARAAAERRMTTACCAHPHRCRTGPPLAARAPGRLNAGDLHGLSFATAFPCLAATRRAERFRGALRATAAATAQREFVAEGLSALAVELLALLTRQPPGLGGRLPHTAAGV